MPWTLPTFTDNRSRISKKYRDRSQSCDDTCSSDEYFDTADDLQPTGWKTPDRGQSEEKRTNTNQIYPQNKIKDNNQVQHDTKDQTGKNSQKDDTSKQLWGNRGQQPPRTKYNLYQVRKPTVLTFQAIDLLFCLKTKDEKNILAYISPSFFLFSKHLMTCI